MFCKYCGNKLVYDTQKYCTVCGKQLDAEPSQINEAPKRKKVNVGKIVMAILKCAGYFALYLAVQVLIGGIYEGVIAGVLTARGVNIFDANSYAGLSREYWNVYSSYSGYVMICNALVTVFVFAMIAGRGKKRFSLEARIRKTSFPSLVVNYVFGFGLEIIVLIAMSFLSVFVPAIGESVNETDVGMELMFENCPTVVFFLFVAVATPILEEVLFRGLIYTRLRKAMPKWPAVIFSAVVFGAAHGNIAQFLYAGALGIILVVVYEKYDSLWAPILVHAGFNSMSAVGDLINFENSAANLMVYAFGIGAFLIGLLFIFVAKPIYKTNEA